MIMIITMISYFWRNFDGKIEYENNFPPLSIFLTFLFHLFIYILLLCIYLFIYLYIYLYIYLFIYYLFILFMYLFFLFNTCCLLKYVHFLYLFFRDCTNVSTLVWFRCQMKRGPSVTRWVYSVIKYIQVTKLNIKLLWQGNSEISLPPEKYIRYKDKTT